MSVEKGIDKNTIFTGFRRDIPQLLASMDVVVLPSGIDACSRVLFEAMAMRKPLVATNAGGTPELCRTVLQVCWLSRRLIRNGKMH